MSVLLTGVEKRLADLRTVLLTTLDDSLDMMTMSTHGDHSDIDDDDDYEIPTGRRTLAGRTAGGRTG